MDRAETTAGTTIRAVAHDSALLIGGAILNAIEGSRGAQFMPIDVAAEIEEGLVAMAEVVLAVLAEAQEAPADAQEGRVPRLP